MVDMTNVAFQRGSVQEAFRAQMRNKKAIGGVGHQIKFDPIEPYPPLDNVENAYIQKMHELDAICARITNGKCQTVPSFLKRLWLILATEDPSIIGWSDDGRGIQIRDRTKMESIILPKYYNHGKMRSFQRQLNYFGFKKTNKSKKEALTFGNVNFNLMAPTDMAKIQRKLRDRKRGGEKRDRSPVFLSKKLPASIEPRKKQRTDPAKVLGFNKENVDPIANVKIEPNTTRSEVETLDGRKSHEDSVAGLDNTFDASSGEMQSVLENDSFLPPPPPTLQLEPLMSEDKRWLNSLAVDDDSLQVNGPLLDLDKLL